MFHGRLLSFVELYGAMYIQSIDWQDLLNSVKYFLPFFVIRLQAEKPDVEKLKIQQDTDISSLIGRLCQTESTIQSLKEGMFC